MGKISPTITKYIVHCNIQIEGVVDKPDIVGAIFGQTEGLLGADLELRELQRSGRIGRIEVEADIKSGKTEGAIILPSSMDKAETAILGAAMETIQRIGPCLAKIKTEKIEDVRVSKRNFVVQRAKELLRTLTSEVLPDSQELTEEVEKAVMVMDITEYGRERLPAGPNINDSEEIIIVEGRADVLNLLKHGFKNVVGMNGTSMPETVKDLAKQKTITLFVDGDRGGDLIIKEVSGSADIDYVTKAPDGKEVEELAKKEIHKAIRSRVAVEQARLDIKEPAKRSDFVKQMNGIMRHNVPSPAFEQQRTRFVRAGEHIKEGEHAREQLMQRPRIYPTKVRLNEEERAKLKQFLDDLLGTRGAYLLNDKLEILGKVPTPEIAGTIKSLNNVYAVVFDGTLTRELLKAIEYTEIKHIIAMDSLVNPSETRINLLTSKELS
ncbi:DNA primase [archaeon]|nr:DNA primase [archaeon]